MQVVPITKANADLFVKNKHYSRRPSIFWAGFALVEDDLIQGVVVYGQPSPPIQKHAFADRDFKLYELARLVVQTKTPNASSLLIGRSLRMLDGPCAVVSYADSSWGHSGIVYQATNWLYTGSTVSHDHLYMVDGERTHPMTLREQENGKRENRPNRLVDGLKEKDLMGVPWRVAFALQADGWYLRQDIIWHKPNPMPESVRDRCTKAHEYIFMLSKSPRYYFDADAIKEPAVQAGRIRADKMGGNKGDVVHNSPGSVFTGSDTRNRRSVWTVPTRPYKGAHFATFPPDLIEPCVLAGAPVGGIVLDPFGGAGTTGLVAERTGRHSYLIELNPDYAAMAADRIGTEATLV